MTLKSEFPGRAINLVISVTSGAVRSLDDGGFQVVLDAEVLTPAALQGQRIEVRHYPHGVYADPEFIADLVTPGRVVLLKSARLMIDKETGGQFWKSSEHTWVDSDNEIAVLCALCRVAKKTVGDRERMHADLLFPSEAVQLRTGDDLQLFAQRYMQDEIRGVENNSNSLIRMIAPASGQVLTSWVYAARKEEVRGSKRFSVPASLSATWDEAFVRGVQSSGLPRVVAAALGLAVGEMSEHHQRLADELKADLESGEIIIEMIPGQRVRAVLGAGLTHFRPESSLGIAAEVCLGPDGPRFVPMTVVLQIGGQRRNAAMTAVLFKAVPDIGFVLYEAKDIPTALYSPKEN